MFPDALRSLSSKLKGFNDEYLARIWYYDRRITKQDIIFGSFDKSGRTWVRFFMAAYVSRRFDLGIEVDWDNFEQLAPGTMFRREGLRRFPSRHIAKPIFSHRRTIGRYFCGRKVVYITRNMLDILVSFYFFHKHRQWHQYGDVDINTFVLKHFDLDEALDRINYFSRQLGRAREVHIVSYEALRHDDRKHFRELIEFTGYGYDEASFDYALERASFRSMQQLEMKGSGSDSTERLHAREGSTNKYEQYLSEDVIDHVVRLLDVRLIGVLRDYYLPTHLLS